MKKRLIIFLFVFLLASSVVFAQGIDDAEDKFDDFGEGVEEGIEGIGNIDEKAKDKWEYLQEEWESILFKNKFISGIDKFLGNFNIVFRVLFAEDYALLSLVMWLVIVFWIFFALFVLDAFRSFLDWSVVPSLGMGVAIAVVFAQLGVFRIIISFVLSVIFSSEMWYIRLIASLLIILVFVGLYYGSRVLTKYLEKKRKLNEEEELKHDKEMISIFAEEAGLGI